MSTINRREQDKKVEENKWDGKIKFNCRVLKQTFFLDCTTSFFLTTLSSA